MTPPTIVKTACPYCGVGCGVDATVVDSNVIAVSGDKDHSANNGRLCVKGTALHETFGKADRLLSPRLYGEAADWDSALDTLVDKLRDTLERHGPDSIGFYLSGQLLTEDYYVANKLVKGFLGSANVDTNSRLCMSSAVSAHKRAFGEDIVPVSYSDVEACDLLVMTGSNAAWSHPVVYQRIVAAKANNPDKHIVVIDTRKTATCDVADTFLQIAPGSDGFLFSGLLVYLANEGYVDGGYVAQHTEGFEQCLDAVKALSIDAVAVATGLTVTQLSEFYSLFARTQRCVTLFSQGINQSATGTDKGNAIINCHLATGRIGKPGAGPFSITGQPNAMGGREVGGLATQLAAHRDFTQSDIDSVARFWAAPAMAQGPGKMAVDLFDDVASGKIKFLWIMATNPAVSLPDTRRVRKALDGCDFVVVSDCSRATDTAAYAHLLLPAAGWGEKDGTVTNSERVISRQRQLIPAAGQARPDWWIVKEVGRRLGFESAFSYQSPAEIFREHAALSGFENNGERAFDISALATLSDEDYDGLQPVRWPCRAGESAEQAAPLLGEGKYYTPSGLARFVAITPVLPEESGTLVVNSGRLRDQWHTMTRTGNVARLARHKDFLSVQINPADAQALALAQGDIAQIENERGSVRALVELDSGQPPGQLFLPIHWSRQFAAQGAVNALFASVVDPVSGQPQSKYAKSRVSRLAVNSWAVLFSREKPNLPTLGYWSRIAVAGGYITLVADRRNCNGLEAVLAGITDEQTELPATYRDDNSDQFRQVTLHNGAVVSGFFVAPERNALPAQSWLAKLDEATTLSAGEALSGFTSGVANTGPLICSCWEVDEAAITEAVVGGADSVEALGEQLKCGTQCGSCIPELKALLQKNCAFDIAAAG